MPKQKIYVTKTNDIFVHLTIHNELVVAYILVTNYYKLMSFSFIFDGRCKLKTMKMAMFFESVGFFLFLPMVLLAYKSWYKLLTFKSCFLSVGGGGGGG